jgi:DNA-binding NarL/FixJ family response regulator
VPRVPDRLTVVEAVWEMELASSQWMTRMACAIRDAVPGIIAPTAFHATVEDMKMRVLDAGAPPGTHHLPVVLGSAAQTPPKLIERTRMQGATGLLAFRHADAPDTGGLDQVAPALSELGGRDIFTVGARDGRGETICLTGAMPSRRPMRPKERRSWESVCAHLSAALRLRQRGLLGVVEDADIVFDARGTVVHRHGWSGTPRSDDAATLRHLRDRIRAIDVRPSRRTDSWMRAVFDGRWSIVARREGTGAVHFLAVKNPVDGAPMRELTAREVEVVRALMRDEPAKVIADDLGITESALARRSGAAFRKMGVRSRAECALVFAALTAICHDDARAIEARMTENRAECALRIAWSVQELCVARGMTPSEASIVPMLIAGVSDAEIARRRAVSRRTVANQTSAIFRKVGVTSRFELARVMTRVATDTTAAPRSPRARQLVSDAQSGTLSPP